jgi:hypothetical protein
MFYYVMVLCCLECCVYQNKNFYFCINNVIFLYIINSSKFSGYMYHLYCILYACMLVLCL